MNELTLSDLNIHHYFGGGVYMKETFIPAGYKLLQHKHRFEHLSLLASGHALVNAVGYRGPAVVTIPANLPHEVIALTDCIWYCIHATEVTDPADVDKVLIAPV